MRSTSSDQDEHAYASQAWMTQKMLQFLTHDSSWIVFPGVKDVSFKVIPIVFLPDSSVYSLLHSLTDK